MHAHDEQHDGQRGDKHRPAPGHAPHVDAAPFGPMTTEAVLALQRSVGNRVVARMLAGAGGADPDVQRGLVDAALRTPGSRLAESRRGRLEEFHQADLSSVRVHTGTVAQRSAEALGARAYTVGRDIVLGVGADNDETIGHETRHVVQQSLGPVAGNDTGAGLAVSDPGHHEEREAAADGAAFRHGAEHAPSTAVWRSAARPAGPIPVQRVKDGDKPDGDQGEQEKGKEDKDKKPKGKTKKSVLDPINEVVNENTLAHGGGRHGRVTEGEVRLTFPRDKSEERDTQSLSHLSLLLYEALRRVQDDLVEQQADIQAVNDREVQGMLINDRLLFASNFNDTIDHLRDRFGDELTSLRNLLDTRRDDPARGLHGPDREEYEQRLARARAKLDAAFEGLRTKGDDATIDAVRGRVNEPVRIVDADDPNIRDFLTSDTYRGAVLMIRYGPADRRKRNTGERVPGSMHAEQKLLVVLENSGLMPDEVKKPIAISGKYKPCAGCAAALRYYAEIGEFNLNYNVNAGHYYQESVNNLATHLRHVVEDPHYREYIADILSADSENAVSTSALSAHEPPAKAGDSDEIRIPAEEALGRGYVTASDSEGEVTDTAGVGRRWRKNKRTRVPYSTDKGKRIGKGSKKSTGGRPVQGVLDEQDRAEITRQWHRGDPNERVKLLRHYANERSMKPTHAELSKVLNVPSGLVSRLISGRTGHEARDNRPVNPDVVRRPARRVDADGNSVPRQRGKGDFTKGRPLDDEGRKQILDEIIVSGFRERWDNAPMPAKRERKRKAETEPEGGPNRKRVKETAATDVISPGDMPKSLDRKVAGLRSRYAVPGMAKYLKFTDDALKNHLNYYYGSVNSKTPAADTPSVGEQAAMDQDEVEVTYPEKVPGYDHIIDPDTQEHYYIDDVTGLPHFYAGGVMVLLPADRLAETIDEQPAAGPSNSREPDSTAMDVDPVQVEMPTFRGFQIQVDLNMRPFYLEAGTNSPWIVVFEGERPYLRRATEADGLELPAPEEDDMEYAPRAHGKGAPRRRDQI